MCREKIPELSPSPFLSLSPLQQLQACRRNTMKPRSCSLCWHVKPTRDFWAGEQVKLQTPNLYVNPRKHPENRASDEERHLYTKIESAKETRLCARKRAGPSVFLKRPGKGRSAALRERESHPPPPTVSSRVKKERQDERRGDRAEGGEMIHRQDDQTPRPSCRPPTIKRDSSWMEEGRRGHRGKGVKDCASSLQGKRAHTHARTQGHTLT